MRIAGLQNLSLVDYPGKVAAAIFVHGCNFKCGYCHNPDLLKSECSYSTTEEEVLDYLTRRKHVLDGVVISGGEPTLYPDLPDFTAKIKATGLDVKLDTNGADPVMLETMLKGHLLDYVAIDIKTSPSKYHLVTDKPDVENAFLASVRLAMLSTVPYEFRTTCMPGLVEEQDIKEIADIVKGAKNYFLQQFRPLNTFDESCQNITPYTKETLELFKSILEPVVERIEIRGI